MFTPMDIGTFDNLLAMEMEKQERNKMINDLIADLIDAKTVLDRQYVMRNYKVTDDDFTDDEIAYINSCLKASRIIWHFKNFLV